MSDGKIIQFRRAMPNKNADDMVEAIKETFYSFADKVSVSEALGALVIATEQLKDDLL